MKHILLISFFIEIIMLFACTNNETKQLNNNTIANTDSIISKKDIKLARLADSLYQIKDFWNAIKLYNTLIERDSLNGYYYYRKAKCLIDNGEILDEIDCYKKSIALNYNVDRSTFNISLCYTQLQQDSLANIYLAIYLQRNPNDKDALELRKLLNLTSGNKSK